MSPKDRAFTGTSTGFLSAICRQFAQSIVHTFFEGEEVKNRRISAEQFE